jgi:predicted DNA-binding transcriptional regulator YafY
MAQRPLRLLKFSQHRRFDMMRKVLSERPAGLLLEEIASMLRLTTRSVRRYLKELERATEIESIPTTPGGPHLWRIKPSERGRTVALRRTQAYGLLATRRVFEPLRGSALYDEMDVVLREIEKIAQRPARAAGEVAADLLLEERFVYVPPPARAFTSRGEELDAFFQCVAELRALRLRHKPRGTDARPERITLHPYAMILHGGRVYCVGRDVARGATRVLAFDDTSEVQASEKETFTLPPDFDASAFVHGDLGVFIDAPVGGRPVRVVVEFDASAADEVRRRRFHPTQKTATAPDGRLRVSFGVPRIDEVCSWVLGFGAAVRVVEPPELAQSVAKELRRALEKYDT